MIINIVGTIAVISLAFMIYRYNRSIDKLVRQHANDGFRDGWQAGMETALGLKPGEFDLIRERCRKDHG
jgi:hypothetical protein